MTESTEVATAQPSGLEAFVGGYRQDIADLPPEYQHPENTPRDELEAAVWALFRKYEITCDKPVELMIELVAAAQAYAAGDSEELTAMRRRLLAEKGQ